MKLDPETINWRQSRDLRVRGKEGATRSPRNENVQRGRPRWSNDLFKTNARRQVSKIVLRIAAETNENFPLLSSISQRYRLRVIIISLDRGIC